MNYIGKQWWIESAKRSRKIHKEQHFPSKTDQEGPERRYKIWSETFWLHVWRVSCQPIEYCLSSLCRVWLVVFQDSRVSDILSKWLLPQEFRLLVILSSQMKGLPHFYFQYNFYLLVSRFPISTPKHKKEQEDTEV